MSEMLREHDEENSGQTDNGVTSRHEMVGLGGAVIVQKIGEASTELVMETKKQPNLKKQLIEKISDENEIRNGLGFVLASKAPVSLNSAQKQSISEALKTITGRIDFIDDPMMRDYNLTPDEQKRLLQLIGVRRRRKHDGGYQVDRVSPQTLSEIRHNAAKGRNSPNVAEQDLLHALEKLFEV